MFFVDGSSSWIDVLDIIEKREFHWSNKTVVLVLPCFVLHIYQVIHHNFPPDAPWSFTKLTMHLFCQMYRKLVRKDLGFPRLNLYITCVLLNYQLIQFFLQVKKQIRSNPAILLIRITVDFPVYSI